MVTPEETDEVHPDEDTEPRPSPRLVLEKVTEERQALIHLCLYALDRARSGGVARRLEQGLAAIGITAIRPEGQPFDPTLHEAGGAISTTDDSLVGTIAETETPGFADHEKLIRAPVVTVYVKSVKS